MENDRRVRELHEELQRLKAHSSDLAGFSTEATRNAEHARRRHDAATGRFQWPCEQLVPDMYGSGGGVDPSSSSPRAADDVANGDAHDIARQGYREHGTHPAEECRPSCARCDDDNPSDRG